MTKLVVLVLSIFCLVFLGVNSSLADFIYQESITDSATCRIVMAPSEANSVIFEETTDGNSEFGVAVNSISYSPSVDNIDPPVLPEGSIRTARLKLYLRNHSHEDIELTVDSLDLQNIVRRNFLLGPGGNEYIAVEDSPLEDGSINVVLSNSEQGFVIYRSVFDMRYEPDSPTAVNDQTQQLPASFKLSANYPNPFNPSTAIEYNLYARSQVQIEIFDVTGRLVRTLVDRIQPAGNYVVFWDGKDNGGSSVPSAVYFYRLSSGSFSDSRKMILLK